MFDLMTIIDYTQELLSNNSTSTDISFMIFNNIKTDIKFDANFDAEKRILQLLFDIRFKGE